MNIIGVVSFVSGHLQVTRVAFFMMLSRADHFCGILTSYCINYLEILCSVEDVAVFDDKSSILNFLQKKVKSP
jgi:hypothetical protein